MANPYTVTEEQEQAIDMLRISLGDTNRFNDCVVKMQGALTAMGGKPNYHAKAKYDEAMRILAEIEDSIKRFREGRPQSFEEDD